MLKRILIVFLTAILSACTTVQGTDNLSQLENLNAAGAKAVQGNISDIRAQALQQTAMTVGAQSGLYWRSIQINTMLLANSKSLDRVYNFNGLMLPHNILPPVLSEGRQILNLADPDTIRLADRMYEIVSQAKFVTTAPNWRDYLWMNFQKAPVPDPAFLPSKRKEQQIWKVAVAKGWSQGIQQANIIYAENVNRLTRDYNGMLLYNTLLAQNIVSAPFVSSTNLGVTGGGSSMNVNDQVLRITALPQLLPNSQDWKPAITQ